MATWGPPRRWPLAPGYGSYGSHGPLIVRWFTVLWTWWYMVIFQIIYHIMLNCQGECHGMPNWPPRYFPNFMDRTLQIINIAWYLPWYLWMTAEPTWANTLRGRWFAYERPWRYYSKSDQRRFFTMTYKYTIYIYSVCSCPFLRSPRNLT